MRTRILQKLSNLNPEHMFVGTALTGAGIGACYGGYHGYMESKRHPFRRNVEETVCGLWSGAIYGSFAGFLWPVTVPVMTSVSLSRLLWPTLKTDIYTEHAKR
jgi:hypothetical protein